MRIVKIKNRSISYFFIAINQIICIIKYENGFQIGGVLWEMIITLNRKI